jgi:N-methylhydantoinase A
VLETPRYRIGVDIGGTFTDLVLVDETGAFQTAKVPSTPPEFVSGLMDGLPRLHREPRGLQLLAHGTTVGTNTVISRSGAKTALVTTEGFRDVLLLRRSDRDEQFNLWWQPPEPIIRRSDIFEVPERLDFRGRVITPLDEGAAADVARQIRDRGYEAVAVVFLHSFANPAHEMRMKQLLGAENPGVFLSVSHEILPEILEYERTATTTLNAYVGPMMASYLRRLQSNMRDAGYEADVVICTSAGGVMGPETAALVPAKTMASGPSAGVMAAKYIVEAAGYQNVLTFDMGGTSLDVGLIDEGVVRRRTEWLAPYGMPIRFPSVDVSSIGAGGGSLGWIDAGGILRSGPSSAGADPGPACYGRGGLEPTSTDAQVVLGRLHPDRFLGGDLPLNRTLAEEAIQTRIANPLGEISTVTAAANLLTIANNNMAQALRLATVYRGYDPRDFVLFAYGGAGPLFAPDVAALGGIPRVIVPPSPGLISALGLLMIDIVHDFGTSVLKPVDEVVASELIALFDQLTAEVRTSLGRENLTDDRIEVRWEVDARYFGTSHTSVIAIERSNASIAQIERAFNESHLREYGYTVPKAVAPVEIVTARVIGIGNVDKWPIRHMETRESGSLEDAKRETRPVYFGGEWCDTPVYERERLAPGMRLTGPAVVEQFDSTTVLAPDMSAEVDAFGNLVIDVPPARWSPGSGVGE